MDYFKQIVVQGCIIAFLATMLIHIPFAWAKIFLVVLLAFVLVMLGNNPLFYYRRLFRVVLLAAIGSLVLGANAQFSGNAALPGGLGAIKFLVDLGSGSPGWVALILVICAGADLGLGWLSARNSKKLLGMEKVRMRVWRATGQELLIVEDLVLGGQQSALTLTGADLRIRALGAPRLSTRLLLANDGGPQTDVTARAPLQIPPLESVPVSVEAKSAGSARTSYIGKRLQLIPNLLPVSGRLALRRETGKPDMVFEIELAP